jgi:hypothetical protein
MQIFFEASVVVWVFFHIPSGTIISRLQFGILLWMLRTFAERLLDQFRWSLIICFCDLKEVEFLRE